MSHWTPVVDNTKRIVEILSTMSLLLITILLLFQISSRRIGISFPGVQTLARVAAIWLTFLLVGNLELDNEHIRVDYFMEQLSPVYRRPLDLLVLGSNIFAVVVLVIGAFLATLHFMDSTLPTVGISSSVIHAAPLLGMILLLFAYLIKMYRMVLGDAVTLEDTEYDQ